MIYEMAEEVDGVFTVRPDKQFDSRINANDDLSNQRAQARYEELQRETGRCWSANAIGLSPDPED